MKPKQQDLRKPAEGPGSPVRSPDERSEAGRSAGEPGPRGAEAGNEVRPKRRTYSAEYKLRVLKEADGCREAGEIGALLRREGLYSSHLVLWRRQRSAPGGLAAKKRGPSARPVDPSAREVERLRRENAKLAARLRQAEALLELQKKLATLLEATRAATPAHDGDAR